MADHSNSYDDVHVLEEFVCDAILEGSVAKLVANSKPATKWEHSPVICEPIEGDAITENLDDQRPKQEV